MKGNKLSGKILMIATTHNNSSCMNNTMLMPVTGSSVLTGLK